MSPVVRHFLPSVVRGVYRADDEFAKIEDERAFKRFVDAKLRFLPPTLAEAFRRQLALDEDFERAQQQQTLPGDSIEPVQTTAQRANAFFRRHAYFENALGTQAEIKGFFEIQFVRACATDERRRTADCSANGALGRIGGLARSVSKYISDDSAWRAPVHKRQNYIMG